MSEERFDRIEAALERIEGRMGAFEGRMDGLETGQRELGARIETLDDEMHLLHEDVVAKIGAVAEFATIVDERMDRRFADVKEAIAREVDPMKAAIRHHSAEIERLNDHGS
jgi:archaellum component FlaC